MDKGRTLPSPAFVRAFDTGCECAHVRRILSGSPLQRNFRGISVYHYRPRPPIMDFHSLYQSYAPQVHRFVLFLCGDATLADDITQRRLCARGPHAARSGKQQ